MRPTLALLLIVFSFASCKKEEDRACYVCTTAYTVSGQAGTSSRTYCDKTAGDIEGIERDGTYTSTGNFAGLTVTIDSRTTCVHQ